ncbi:BgTH12-00594 [Blumeria graminis f. sp. triticale]|uniref:U3 small nucleolar ribonucleoprotein protein MPP10 n=4 Tax=Blumeria graminis TaxID=34373 RepID=A0A656KFB5_BLUGR|nr:Component of the SSU processome and 90S preribosome [Blumeria graminis f. sp. tritici 96224]CAD6505096.1 BgTH12-00594 [Blumeria graminis f. sp. triticale]VDB93101.1 Bgt-236 [Blumeria graminis f. sp. tritici]
MALGESDASLTSSSHTMMAMPPASDLSNVSATASSVELTELLAPSNRQNFIIPAPDIPDASLHFVKSILDDFAGALADEQSSRLKTKNNKGRAGGRSNARSMLQIRKIHTHGFEVEKIWEQARRVIDALREDVEENLQEIEQLKSSNHTDTQSKEIAETMNLTEDNSQLQSSGKAEQDDPNTTDQEDNSEMDEASEFYDEQDLQEESDKDNWEDEIQEDEIGDKHSSIATYHEDPHGLNDGFFSIDEFNKLTEFLEHQDTMADEVMGDSSDDEEIDWDADPSAKNVNSIFKTQKKSKTNPKNDEEASDGPTFGDMDLNAPDGESDEDDFDGMEEDTDTIGDNTNDIMYQDFFQPPPRKIGKGERQANYLERNQKKRDALEPEDQEATLKRAMADVRRDIFDDNSEHSNSDEEALEIDPADPRTRRSAHERKQAKILQEIQRLEAKSIAKREWTLSGEARASDRPQNSLLEQEIDFERTGKPVLEVTAEISESIEELVKRRILAQEFDEVIRRRPEDLIKTNLRKGAFELDDSKPQQSLAEMYAEDHLKAKNPETHMSKADEKIKKEEKEIEILWKELSAKLDALSSWHFKPKAAAPSLTVVSDVAKVSMEDAQPTMASGINGSESMLAPQEIYKAGKDKQDIAKGEVVLASGAPVAREEMTREEKLRRRRRAKERLKKRGELETNKAQRSVKTNQNKETLLDLKKGGVKMIGKKGDVRDMNGRQADTSASYLGAGRFKL